MRLPSNLNLQVVCLIALLLLLDTFAQIFFKLGVTQLGEFPTGNFSNMCKYSLQLAQNIYIIGGVVALIFAFFTWLILISKVDLSFAHPMTSLDYAIIPIIASFMLHEPLHWNQIIGILIIVLGVFIVSDETN